MTRFLLHDINNSSFTKATHHRPRGKNENVEKRENRTTRQFDHKQYASIKMSVLSTSLGALCWGTWGSKEGFGASPSSAPNNTSGGIWALRTILG